MTDSTADTRTRGRLTRRAWLKGAGATTVLIAGGGVWRAASQGVFAAGTGPAYEPWETWRTDRPAGALGIVHAGILAANPHDTQPWLFRVSETTIDVYADVTRHLGSMDPFLREMHLGLGCAVENMMLAARAFGYEPTVALEPGALTEPAEATEPQLVARLTLAPGSEHASALYAAIERRHTNRGPYDAARPVAADLMGELAALGDDEPDVRVSLVTAPDQRTLFAQTTVEATGALIADHAMVRDSDAWFRYGPKALHTHRDGITLDSAGLPPFITVIAKMLPPLSAEQSHLAWLKSTDQVHCATAAAFGLIAVHDLYDREQTLCAGRVWQRMHLWATTRGIAMHPLNQMVEMVDRDRQLRRAPKWAPRVAALVVDSTVRATFAFRLGYAVRPAGPSPRRAVRDVLV